MRTLDPDELVTLDDETFFTATELAELVVSRRGIEAGMSIELKGSDGRPKYWVETSTRLVSELSEDERYKALA
jgi:hypothetical protein